MPPRHAGGGTSDPKKRSSDCINVLLTHMMAVEEEVFRFNLHFAAQNVIKQPLNHWPTYKGYHHLVSAVKDLDVSVQCFQLVIKTASAPPKSTTKAEVVRAREISLYISNIVASVLKILDHRAAEYLSQPERQWECQHAHEFASMGIVGILDDAIEHSTGAARSIWAAVDVLESVPTTKNRKTVSSNPPSNECCSCNSKVQNATLSEFRKRVQVGEKALEDHSERIDNIWEALGPPNAKGGFFKFPSPVAPRDKPSADLLKKIEKVAGDVLELKRQVQRSNVRLGSRLSKVECKQGC